MRCPRRTRRARSHRRSGCSSATRTSCATWAFPLRSPRPTCGRSSTATRSRRIGTTSPRSTSRRRRSRRCSSRLGPAARTRRPSRVSASSSTAPRGGSCRVPNRCSPATRHASTRGSSRPRRRSAIESASVSTTGRRAAPLPIARSTRTGSSYAAAIGTWLDSTANAAKSAPSGSRGCSGTSVVGARRRRRPRAFARPSTSAPDPGAPARRASTSWWRSHPTSPGGRRRASRASRTSACERTAGGCSAFRRRRGTASCRGCCRSVRMPSCWSRLRSGRKSSVGSRSSLPERRPGGAKAAERLRRLLVIVPYLVQHPGTEVAELGRLFGVEEGELLEDLGRLFLSGLPPYGPGDLIGVDIEDGRVWVEMADYFSRPLRLTRPEALALYLRGTALAATPGVAESSALAAAVRKLGAALEPGTLGDVAGHVEAAGGARPAEALDTMRAAVERHETLRIQYYAQSSAETTEREIAPEAVFLAIGHWYVAAWDHRSDEERLFRADRIRSATPTGERFEPRGLEGAGRALYTPSERDVDVRLRLGPDARWVAEYYAVDEVAELDDGGLEVSLPAARMEWIARLLLRLGDDVEVLEPQGLKDRLRELAHRTRKPYLDSSPDTVRAD